MGSAQNGITFTQVDDVDTILQASSERPIILFKHSLTCGISAQALDELAGLTGIEAPLVLLTIQTQRTLSQQVAARFGIRHESPQVLIVRDGRAVWHASHFRVTEASVLEALRSTEVAKGAASRGAA